MTTERNHSIDSLKLLCALIVVFIHCKYPYKAEVLPITDVAVPLFFCISGYFVFGAKRNLGRINRIMQIFAWSAALYLVKTEVLSLLTTHSLWIPSWHAVTNLLLFNDVAFSIHLWYLPAYIYVLVIAFFIDKYDFWKTSFHAIIPLLLTGVLIKYSLADICPEEIQYYRNAYFTGLPYFLVGAMIKITPPSHLNRHWQRVVLAIAIVALFVVRYLFTTHSLIIMATREIDLLLLTAAIFLLTTLCVQHKDNLLSQLGRRYSLYIYIFHVLIMSICEMVVTKLPSTLSEIYMYINPICVFLLSIALTYMLGKLKILKV